MSLSESLWRLNEDLAIACLQNKFVQGIASGSLPKYQFSYYVGQDAFFLEAFARAYCVAAARCGDWQGFEVFHGLASGVLEELKLHKSYAKKWGVNLAEVRPAAATRRYTDFLLATAWSSEVGVTAAAMVPCMRLYAFLGQSLAKNGIPDHVYGEWIATYSNVEFEGLAKQLETLLDSYAVGEKETEAYRYAMQCELDFFQAAWEL
ncbi:TenA family protein [Ancylothrix sp. C2]|uniref:TenA family protein n=1 Tax=Ancylothrix sp. D3o TaxID=2953691 RepID=UPI0021BB937F|nr:TenA family protein [Ancylothrix sp. D3o]MCT7951452.1 TenA family protein [Ancylothrix sp. D3o]